MKLTKQETATVLAALRYFQSEVIGDPNRPLSEHFLDVNPLNEKEIDALCERVNCETSKIFIVIERGNLQGVYADTPLEYEEVNIDEDAEDPLVVYEGQTEPIRKFNEGWEKTLKKHRASER